MSSPKLTQKKQESFLRELASHCNATRAAVTVGLDRGHVYQWRRSNPAFALAWDEALKIGAEALEDEAKRRAYEGVDEPVFYQGTQVSTVRKYSDTLLIFLLKGALPEKYAERAKTELTGNNGGPVQFSDTERAARIAALLDAAKVRKAEDDRQA